jgi:hypothetical protein
MSQGAHWLNARGAPCGKQHASNPVKASPATTTTYATRIVSIPVGDKPGNTAANGHASRETGDGDAD